jgi:hypothetical protein
MKRKKENTTGKEKWRHIFLQCLSLKQILDVAVNSETLLQTTEKENGIMRPGKFKLKEMHCISRILLTQDKQDTIIHV